MKGNSCHKKGHGGPETWAGADQRPLETHELVAPSVMLLDCQMEMRKSETERSGTRDGDVSKLGIIGI